MPGDWAISDLVTGHCFLSPFSYFFLHCYYSKHKSFELTNTVSDPTNTRLNATAIKYAIE